LTLRVARAPWCYGVWRHPGTGTGAGRLWASGILFNLVGRPKGNLPRLSLLLREEAKRQRQFCRHEMRNEADFASADDRAIDGQFPSFCS